MNQRRYKPSLDRIQRLLLPERVEDYVERTTRSALSIRKVPSLEKNPSSTPEAIYLPYC